MTRMTALWLRFDGGIYSSPTQFISQVKMSHVTFLMWFSTTLHILHFILACLFWWNTLRSRCRLSGTVNRTKVINRPCNDWSITWVWLTCWGSLWCRLYKTNMFCWRTPLLAHASRQFQFITIIITCFFKNCFLIMCFFLALPIALYSH